ncbi:MAG: hypothetical protein AAFV85_17360 [Cyanobacteria bacterium J06634_6]
MSLSVISSVLAYTTVSDLFCLPTPLEAAIYLAGLLFLMACPYVFVAVADRVMTAVKKTRQPQPCPEPQQPPQQPAS